MDPVGIINEAKEYVAAALLDASNGDLVNTVQNFSRAIDIQTDGLNCAAVILKEVETSNGGATPPPPVPSEGRSTGNYDDEDKAIQSFLENCKMMISSDISLDDVVGFSEPLKDIKSRIDLPILMPSAFTYGVKPFSLFLLYGLPGIGKTKFAAAIASYAQAVGKYSFFSTSASSMMSRWLGSSEKMFTALLDRVKQDAPAILFLDEVDELLCKRDDKQSETSGRMKSLFLTSVEGIRGNMEGVIIIAATNRPGVIDSAAWSRFHKKYYIPLPTVNERRELFKHEMKQLPTLLNEQDFKQFGKMTEGFSGRDIRNVIAEAWTVNVLTHSNIPSSVIALEKATVLQVLRTFRSSVREKEVEEMESFLEGNEV